MPIPFALIGAGVSAGASLLGGYLNKPKKSDYETKANTKGMDKYIAYLKGRSSGDEAYQLAMRPQQRAIGKQTAKARRDIQGYMGAQGMEGSGAAAQARLSLQQQTSDQLTNVHEQATAQQIQDRRQSGEKIAQLQSDRVQAIEDARLQSEKAYNQARSQWKSQMTQTAIQGLAGIATAGISTMQQSAASMQAAHQAALSSGAIDPGTTMADFKSSYKASDFASPETYATSLGAQQTNQSILAQGTEYLGESKTQELLASGYTHQDVLKEIEFARGNQQAYMKAGIESGTITPDNMGAYYDAFGGGSGTNADPTGEQTGTIDQTTNEVVGSGGINTQTTADGTFVSNLGAGIDLNTLRNIDAGKTRGIGSQGTYSGEIKPPQTNVNLQPPVTALSNAASVGQGMTPDRLSQVAGGNPSDPFAIGGNVNQKVMIPKSKILPESRSEYISQQMDENKRERLRQQGVNVPLSVSEQQQVDFANEKAAKIKEEAAKIKEEEQAKIAETTLANQGVEPLSGDADIADAEAADKAAAAEAKRRDLILANMGVEEFTDPELTEPKLSFWEKRKEKRRVRKLEKERKREAKKEKELSKKEQKEFEAGATSTAMKDQEEALDFEAGAVSEYSAEQLAELETNVSEATEDQVDSLINDLPPGEYEFLEESIGDIEKASPEKKRKGIINWLKEKKKARKAKRKEKQRLKGIDIMKQIRADQRGRVPVPYDGEEIDIEEFE